MFCFLSSVEIDFINGYNKPMQNRGYQSIGESESRQNIMRQMNLPLQQLGPCDKEIYYYIWS
jgi:hypothetical protein